MRLRAVLAQNLRRHRQLKGWSQEHLAHEAGVTSAYVSAIERQVSAASIDIIEKLAAALEIPPSRLLAEPKGKPEARRR